MTNDYYTEENLGPHDYFDLGDFRLSGGGILKNAKIAYRTKGVLNGKKDNAILFPHMWSGTSKSMEIFVGDNRPLDPSKYFIIFPGQFGNGFSSSPSNALPPQDQGSFPPVMIGDDVVAQYRLVTEIFGISELQLVLGWSMGAEQTYEWAVRYPDMVKRALPFAGTAKTTPHDYLFVRAHENTLKSDPAWNNGSYRHSSDVTVGLKRHAELWSVMGLCPEFYKQEIWASMGFKNVDEFVSGFWEGYFAPMDPNNLICMAWKWRHGDVSLHCDGDLAATLGLIKAKTLVVAFGNDMFFPPKDCELEAAMIPNSEFRVVDSLWAHFTMFCFDEKDRIAIDQCIGDILA